MGGDSGDGGGGEWMEETASLPSPLHLPQLPQGEFQVWFMNRHFSTRVRPPRHLTPPTEPRLLLTDAEREARAECVFISVGSVCLVRSQKFSLFILWVFTDFLVMWRCSLWSMEISKKKTCRQEKHARYERWLFLLFIFESLKQTDVCSDN